MLLLSKVRHFYGADAQADAQPEADSNFSIADR